MSLLNRWPHDKRMAESWVYAHDIPLYDITKEAQEAFRWDINTILDFVSAEPMRDSLSEAMRRAEEIRTLVMTDVTRDDQQKEWILFQVLQRLRSNNHTLGKSVGMTERWPIRGA